MRSELLVLLERLKRACGKEYKIFSVGEVAAMSGDKVTEDEALEYVRQLFDDGYVDLKYQDSSVVLVRPLDKEVLTRSEVERDEDSFRRLCVLTAIFAFVGAFVGGVAAVVVAIVVC